MQDLASPRKPPKELRFFRRGPKVTSRETSERSGRSPHAVKPVGLVAPTPSVRRSRASRGHTGPDPQRHEMPSSGSSGPSASSTLCRLYLIHWSELNSLGMSFTLGEVVGMPPQPQHNSEPRTCVGRSSRRREGTRCPAETAAPHTFQPMEGICRCLLHELARRLLIASADALETFRLRLEALKQALHAAYKPVLHLQASSEAEQQRYLSAPG